MYNLYYLTYLITDVVVVPPHSFSNVTVLIGSHRIL